MEYRNVSFATSESYPNGMDVVRDVSEPWGSKLSLRHQSHVSWPSEDQGASFGFNAGGRTSRT